MPPLRAESAAKAQLWFTGLVSTPANVNGCWCDIISDSNLKTEDFCGKTHGYGGLLGPWECWGDVCYMWGVVTLSLVNVLVLNNEDTAHLHTWLQVSSLHMDIHPSLLQCSQYTTRVSNLHAGQEKHKLLSCDYVWRKVIKAQIL